MRNNAQSITFYIKNNYTKLNCHINILVCLKILEKKGEKKECDLNQGPLTY